jgi:hypothetical protein
MLSPSIAYQVWCQIHSWHGEGKNSYLERSLYCEANWSSASEEPRILWIPMVHCIHKRPPPVPAIAKWRRGEVLPLLMLSDMYFSFPVSTYELVVSLGLCTLQSHVVPCRLRATCNKASKFLLFFCPHVQNLRSCIVVHQHAVVRQGIFVSCLYQNYFVLFVDTPFRVTELQLAKTDDRTFVYVAVPTQGTLSL